MRKFFAVAMGSVVALAGFASTANASATVDLIWIDKSDTTCLRPIRRDCPRLGTTLGVDPEIATSDNVTLLVLLTAGPGGSIGGGVSVDYSSATATYTVNDFRSLTTIKPAYWLPLAVGTTTDQDPFVDNINAAASPPTSSGLGLPAGQSAYLGTVSFHKDLVVNGTFEITVGNNGPGGTDGILDGGGADITGTTAFNSAYLVNVPEPNSLFALVTGTGGLLLARRCRKS